ncbi:unnamed protein product [Dovyalis caffra]|uniref:Defective in cullin neddylation protein n=1 Tax=Dovyalis caffra TaxID=77055 RepID=A0AAV1RS10_9ROSI|nr:unnamed protein product [Dovyalis caffra]
MPPRASKRKAAAPQNSSAVTSFDDCRTGTVVDLAPLSVSLDFAFAFSRNRGKDEWRSGLKALKVDSLGKLKKVLPELEKEVNTQENFQDFYSYAFRYCLTEEKQKTVDIESVCELLNLVLGSQFQSKVDSLIVFLKIQTDYKAINLDQWMGFLRFCKEHIVE